MSDGSEFFDLKMPPAIRILRQLRGWPGFICLLASTAVFGLLLIRPLILSNFQYLNPSLIVLFFRRADIFYVSVLVLALISTGALLYNVLTPRWSASPPVGENVLFRQMPTYLDTAPIDTPPDLHHQVRATISRINRELDALAIRVKLNLIIGILLAIVGLTALGYLVITLPRIDPKSSSPWWYLAEFAPKLSFVLLIDIFAYFFLNLYKATLGDVKYFQNELTNYESRTLALSAAVGKSDAKTAAAVILELSKTERNYMKKDFTNLDLERAKAEQQGISDILKHVASIVKIGTGGKAGDKE
jgi:hypothetical protein